MNKLNITEGDWFITLLSENKRIVYSRVATEVVCEIDDTTEGTTIGKANAKLIAEAGTVYNETWKSPRQMQAEIKLTQTTLTAEIAENNRLRKAFMEVLESLNKSAVKAAIKATITHGEDALKQ